MPSLRRLKLSAGRSFGDWTLEPGGELGRDVWAVQKADGTLGVLKKQRDSSRLWRSRFTYEVDVLQRLQGLPGVLRLLDRDPASQPAWMVTERAQLLVQHLGPEPDFRSVVSAFAEIASTLVEARAAGVAHRDIKPSNLFHTRGRAVVGDFGLATGHDYKDLTMQGGKVGPANFAAPEALEWSEDVDPYPVDVFSLAKSLWAVAAEKRYPPQGPLLIRLREVDLADFGGRPAQDLSRLLEIATRTHPKSRPNMATVRDELDVWLSLNPKAIPRPEKRRFRTTFDEYYSAPALERQGLPKVIEYAVHQILDGCRTLRPVSSSLTEDPDAWLEPPLERLSDADPDWVPDAIATKKLVWMDLPDVRLVGTAVLEGEDDMTYDVAWHVRAAGTLTWAVVWRASARVELRLPSDIAKRRELQRQIQDHAPSRLGASVIVPTGKAADALRRIAGNAEHRENARTGAEARAALRQVAAAKSVDIFDDFWERLGRFVGTVAPEVRLNTGQGAWLMNLKDRRLVVQLAEPASGRCPAVQLGIITVEAEGDVRSPVANLCALLDSEGAPVWQLLRMQRNDLAAAPASVSESRADRLGAVSLHDLESHFEEQEQGLVATSVTTKVSSELTPEGLALLFAAEVEALDQRHST